MTRTSPRICSALLLLAACGDPGFEVREAREMGTVAGSSLIQGRDGGGSGKVWGHSVWAFGDTVVNVPDVDGQTWHNNSFSITDDTDPDDGIGGFSERTDAAGSPLHFVAPTADEADFAARHRGDPCAESPCGAHYAAWPGPPIFDEKRGRALIPYGLVWEAPGDFNFHGVGQSFAVWSDFGAEPQRPVVAPGTAHPTLIFVEGEPAYGAAPVIEGDTLYSFACERDGLSFHCTLASVGLDHVLERSAWRFWDGKRWSTRMTDASPLFDAGAGVTVTYNRHLSRWTAIYSGVFSDDVHMRTAPKLTGPWSAEGKLFTSDRNGHGGNTYDANPHPEYDQEGGRILYISYSRSTGQGWFGSELVLERVVLK